MKLLIINGPNLNLLGRRQPEIYGQLTLEQVMSRVQEHGAAWGAEVDWCQSNDEGELARCIGDSIGKYDGLILNPGAYTHTSVALRDALQAVEIPCVEVHLSNIYAREPYRHESLTAGACLGQICGFGALSYCLALEGLVDYLKTRRTAG